MAQDIMNNTANAIINYCNSLSVGDILIISQLERTIGNIINNADIDVIVTTPNTNIVPTSTEVIRNGTITINGAVWNG